MSQHSGFFESIWDESLVNPQTGTLGDWDIKYYYDQFANYFSKFFGNGVYYNPDNNLKVLALDNMAVVVKKGWAFINGFWYELDDDMSLNVPANTTAYTRTDSVILRWSLSERTISLIYATDTTIPTRSDSIYDLIIAQIEVEPSVVSVLGDKITDTRTNTELCGIVRGLEADSIDTDTLFAQYDAIFNEWFDDIKGQVEGDLAVRLQLEFTQLNQNVETYQANVTQIANNALSTITSFVANYFVLPLQTLTFVNKRCEIADERVTADSLVDVYFTAETMNNAEAANIYVDSQSGKIVLTCSYDPIGVIQARIGVRN